MSGLSENTIFIFITQLGVIILFARICGEIARRFGQPILVGEVIAGILLGPLVFGRMVPEFFNQLFPQDGINPALLGGISWLCVLFLLLITGLEIDFRSALRYGKQNILTSFFGFVFPFAFVYSLSFLLPAQFFPWDHPPQQVQLFLATSLAVASVPVIGKILFDLKIFHSSVGLNIITSSIMSDIWEWSTLLLLISYIVHQNASIFVAIKPILSMLLLLAIALTAGKKIIEKLFKWTAIQTKDTAAVFSLLFSITLLMSAVAHFMGIHVVFGAFLAGLMIGESDKLTPHMRQSVQDFIFGFFAPIFFVLIGMQLRIGNIENWIYIILFMVAASLGKIGGAFWGALLGGIGKKNAFAVGCGLNAQGAMGIVVAMIGVGFGVINEELFTLIVVISVASALTVGPLLKWAMKAVRRPLADFFTRDHIFANVSGQTKAEIIDNIVELMAQRKIIQDPQKIRQAIWERENSLSTGIGDGIALPHARIVNLKKPLTCFFKLARPIDFNSPDNQPVQLVFLELTDSNDHGMQLNLIAQISRFLAIPENKEKILNCRTEEEIYHVLSLDETV